ncbi:MAG: hypothetical protein HPY53_14875 [Brevinematales bacterium]|nr:hypothetical protein [Brevinematales bacterium]
MKKWLMITGFVALLGTTGHAWRAIGKYFLGSEANGIGGAYSGYAESELAVHYNPAGLVQMKGKWTFMFEVSTGIYTYDLLSANFKLIPDFFPFFSTVVSVDGIKLGLSLTTLFDGYTQESLFVRTLKVTAAFPILENLALGVGLGPVFAFESTGIGYGWSANIGLLWKISDDFQIGVCFHTPIPVEWSNPVMGSSLSEVYPAILDMGISWNMTETSMLFFSLEYLAIDGIKYILNGQDRSPVFESNLLSRVHPHLGFRFLEPSSGAHISCGMMIDSDYYDTGGINQYLLTVGVRAYGRNMVFHASLIDALLFSIVYPYNTAEERVNIGMTFQIF